MFARHQIMGVANGRVVTKPHSGSSNTLLTSMPKKNHTVTADMMNTLGPLSSASPATSTSINFFAASNYQYYMTGLIPAQPTDIDSSLMSLFYRDIYLYDAVGGCAVNIQSSFPFSDWELRGLSDDQLKIYNDALERLGIRDLLPKISTAYLVDGFYAGSLVFDDQTKCFMDILSYDSLQCQVTASPFNNIDPEVIVHTSGMMKNFLNNHSTYVDKYLQEMPKGIIDLLNQEQFVLDPISTLFIGRRCLLDRAYTSYLQALLPTYLIEKTLFRGTLTEAQRRQRSTSHITAGDDVWTPTSEELAAIVQQFQMSENDPNGAWVATRNAIQVSDVRPAGDFWKWTDTADQLVSMKLRALGISEAFLSGDASYSSSESAYSTFIETVNSYRDHLTNKIFYNKIFPLIAVVKGLYKEGTKNKCDNPIDFLFNITNRQNLLMPKLHWHKELTTREEDSQFDMLQNLSELGVPVAIKTWISAAGLDYDSLLRDLREDQNTRAELAQFTQQEDQQQDDNYTEAKLKPMLTAMSNKSKIDRRRTSILSYFENTVPEDMTYTDSVGKKHWSLHQEKDRKDQNWKLAKIAARMHKDINYRKSVAKANASKGISKLAGFTGD